MTRREHWRDVRSPVLEPEEVAWLLFNSAKSKAKGRKLEFSLKYNDVLRPVRTGKCAVSGIAFDHRAKPVRGVDLPFRASLDRVDNTRGYFPDNIQVVCCIYNRAKLMWGRDDVLRLAMALIEKDASLQEEMLRRYIAHNQGDLNL